MAGNETIKRQGENNGGAYRAFLLRCWQEEAGGGAPWRFTLAEVGEERTRQCFASLEDLFSYLRAELESNFAKNKPK